MRFVIPISFRVCNLSDVSAICAKAVDILLAADCPQELTRRVSICLYEGCTNMAAHAGGGDVELSSDRDEVRLQFVDHGSGIPDIDWAMRRGSSTAGASERQNGIGGGMGMANLRYHSDHLTIQTSPHGTVLRLTLRPR